MINKYQDVLNEIELSDHESRLEKMLLKEYFKKRNKLIFIFGIIPATLLMITLNLYT
jgi:hypothetical protein